tara:strand:+ start:757 stop:2058 length:1302 start_codon:yes stop_codon:yes gene_type:complete
MKISFIVPSWHYYSDPFKHQPFWEIYYATNLKKQGYDVSVHDMRSIESLNFTDHANKIPESDFYFYWIFKSGDAAEIYSIAKYLKEKFPKSTHAAGGTHVDMCQDESKEFFDSIVVGAGENSFQNIIEDKKNRKLKKIYSQDYKLQPFADTPFPDRSFLPIDKVVNNKLFSQYGDIKATLTYFSRGCIFKCAYCTYNVPRLLQVKSPQLIIDEINYLKNEYGIKGILVKDEIAISPNKKISEETMSAIEKTNIVWRGQTISIATLDQLKRAKDSGCLELAVGVETVDNNVMKIIDKTWQNDKIIRDFIENSKKVGIKVKICLILGLPGEPIDIVDKTINFLKDSEPDYASVSGFLPVPGSPIQKKYEDYGIKYIDTDWNKYGHLLNRFSDEEDVGLPFEYHKDTKWGKSFTRKQITENINEVQNWLRTHNMIY